MRQTEAIELCPWCGSENIFPHFNLKRDGYIAICQYCGEELMLCDECYHCKDSGYGRCDWHQKVNDDNSFEGHCFRGVTHHPKKGGKIFYGGNKRVLS